MKCYNKLCGVNIPADNRCEIKGAEECRTRIAEYSPPPCCEQRFSLAEVERWLGGWELEGLTKENIALLNAVAMLRDYEDGIEADTIRAHNANADSPKGRK